MTPRDVHIVIVDDDPPVRRALARLLTASGFHVSVCGSAEEYLERNPDPNAGCLLLDVQLPQLSGLALTTVLDRLTPRVPIVLITADQAIARSVTMRGTAWPCLVKPFDDEALLAAISLATSRP